MALEAQEPASAMWNRLGQRSMMYSWVSTSGVFTLAPLS
jgi:hypothetical protein